MDPQLQNLLIVAVMLGYALMELATRRYQTTVHATGDDTKLEFFQFLALLAIAQPLALLVTNKLCLKFVPEQFNLETAVERARAGCDAACGQGVNRSRAQRHGEDLQRRQRAAARLDRVRSAVTHTVK